MAAPAAPLLTSLELSKQDERLRWLELIRSNLAGYRPGATALQVEGVAAALLRSLGHLGLLAVLWPAAGTRASSLEMSYGATAVGTMLWTKRSASPKHAPIDLWVARCIA